MESMQIELKDGVLICRLNRPEKHNCLNHEIFEGLEIAINEGSFISGTKDLVKYILEHEIYEAWLMLNSKDNNEDFDICHLLARKHEYRLAVADGNGLRLLKYHKLCVSNSDNCMQQTEEFQYAYDLALKRRPTPQLERVYIE